MKKIEEQEDKFRVLLKQKMDERYKAMNKKAIVFKRKKGIDDSGSEITESDITDSEYMSSSSYAMN